MSEKSHVGMTSCYYCGESLDILLHRQLRKVFPNHGNVGVQHLEPCPACKNHMKTGIILMGVDEEKSDLEQFQRDKERWDAIRKNSGNYGSTAYKLEMKRNGMHPYVPPQDHVYRSGHFLVVSEGFIQANIKPKQLAEMILKYRWSFISGTMAQQIVDHNESTRG